MDQQLFSELRIGPVSVRNRIVHTAPGAAYAGVDGDANRPTAELAAYWERLARGGVGLIVSEPQSVHPASTLNPRTVENVSDDIVPLYRRVTDAVHDHGARIVGRLWHGGFLGTPGYRSLPLWAPSAVRAPAGAPVPNGGGGIPYAMTRRDISELVEAFAGAARRLRDATFDGVEVDASGGFLLAEYLSPKVNRRADEYGGNLENRCRFVVEVLRGVRQAIGGSLALGIRLSPDPYVEPGIVAEDLPAIAARLAQSVPLDFVNVLPALLPDASSVQGTEAETTRAVRRAAGVAVIYNGRLTDPAAAAALVRDGEIDLVAMSRAILADAQLPVKARTGRTTEIRDCIACNQTCTGDMGSAMGMGTPYCLFNPLPDEEEALARLSDGTGCRLLVIGAGLAGLEAARLARMRGFAVTIWERAAGAGGQILLAAAAPQRTSFASAIDFYLRQLAAWGIELKLGMTATPEAVDEFDPDVVVVATGSVPAMPAWWAGSRNGASDGRVIDVRSALLDPARLGSRVVIAMAETDHGFEALPLAEVLADAGHQVTVVCAAFEPSMTQDFYNSEQLYRRLPHKGVRFVPTTEVTGVRPGEAEVRNVYSQLVGSLPADSVVVSLGGVADDSLYAQLTSRRPNVHSAGDCVAPRDMAGAILDGIRVMRNITVPAPA